MILLTPTSLLIALTVTLKSTDDGRLKTKLYDKRDDFQIVTFPITSRNILASLAYGVILGSVHNAVIFWTQSSAADTKDTRTRLRYSLVEVIAT